MKLSNLSGCYDILGSNEVQNGGTAELYILNDHFIVFDHLEKSSMTFGITKRYWATWRPWMCVYAGAICNQHNDIQTIPVATNPVSP